MTDHTPLIPLLCPMKFANAHPPEMVDWNCEFEGCAWWSKGRERCAPVAATMALWALVDALKGQKPMESHHD